MNREFNTTRIRMDPTPIELAKVRELFMNYDVFSFLYFSLLQLTSFILIFFLFDSVSSPSYICEMRDEEMDPHWKFEIFDDEMVAENNVRSNAAEQARDQIAHYLLHHGRAGTNFL